jgi:hypothetical protein
MKVSIKNLGVSLEEDNKGVEFDINDNQDKFLGSMTVNKSGLVWCRGKTKAKASWKDLIEWMDNNSI